MKTAIIGVFAMVFVLAWCTWTHTQRDYVLEMRDQCAKIAEVWDRKPKH